jgi:hypothetical protein
MRVATATWFTIGMISIGVAIMTGMIVISIGTGTATEIATVIGTGIMTASAGSA